MTMPSLPFAVRFSHQVTSAFVASAFSLVVEMGEHHLDNDRMASSRGGGKYWRLLISGAHLNSATAIIPSTPRGVFEIDTTHARNLCKRDTGRPPCRPQRTAVGQSAVGWGPKRRRQAAARGLQ
jgi:hypothetical protein